MEIYIFGFNNYKNTHVRNRPFNLQGGYGFLFHSEVFFRTTRELDYSFFPPPKSEYFFQQHWESEYFFLEKKHRIILTATI